jgi:hypothetical protein
MLRALAPERLTRDHGPTDVTKYDDFVDRYCVTRTKVVGWTRIKVVVAGKNTAELGDRMRGFWLRRTQEDVGIDSPIFDLLPVHITPRQRAEVEAAIPDAADILAAAETGETKSLDIHLGTLRRVTGTIKVAGVVRAVADELEGNAEKVVLMCWHHDVMDHLASLLGSFGLVCVSGTTLPEQRAERVHRFQTDPTCRVFVGQIQAAGEAIDLSAASELIFVETSFVPAHMAQAAMRVTNLKQTRRPRVRVAALEGSVDEAVQAILLRKVATNKAVMA